MRRILLLACLLAPMLAGPARAQDFRLPGLDADARTYAGTLSKPYPAGGTQAARAAAEQRAASALARRDYPAAAAALEQRAGMGSVTAQQWLDLASAELRRTPPDPRRAMLAAWEAFGAAPDAQAEIPPLLLLAEALRAQNRDAQAVQALEQVVARAPDDAGYKRLLADAQRAAGMAVRGVAIEGEADPPRACIGFTVPPSRRADFMPQDWVKLAPPVPGAAVTHEGDQICISGLPSGATTRATLRAGLPAQPRDQGAALSLAHDVTLALAVPNRVPRVVFDTRLFVLPHGQAPSVTLTTTNLSSVKLTLQRLSERNVAPFVRDNTLGAPVDQYAARSIGSDSGRTVWQGKADIPDWQPNKPARIALPLPPPLLTAGPGLYALLATPATARATATASAVQMIVRTDLAPTVWRGADGLTVQVRGYTDAQVRPGVVLRLLAHNNDMLGEATTDADGSRAFRRAAAARRRAAGAAPLLHAFGADGDLCVLDLNAARSTCPIAACGAAASRPARCLRLARSRHLPARRDGAGDGADARRCRPARRPAGAPHRPPAKRSGVPATQPAAPAGGGDPSAGGALARCRGRHVDGGGAGRSRRPGDRPRRVPRRCIRARPHGGRFRPAAGPIVPGQPTPACRLPRGSCTARRPPVCPAMRAMRLTLDPAPFPGAGRLQHRAAGREPMRPTGRRPTCRRPTRRDTRATT